MQPSPEAAHTLYEICGKLALLMTRAREVRWDMAHDAHHTDKWTGRGYQPGKVTWKEPAGAWGHGVGLWLGTLQAHTEAWPQYTAVAALSQSV